MSASSGRSSDAEAPHGPPADGGAGLCLRLDPDAPSHSTVWFEVDDARAVAAGLGLEAFRIATGWSVEMTDPWGNTVGFTDYRG